MRQPRGSLPTLALAVATVPVAAAGELDLSGYLAVESRGFADSPSLPGQLDGQQTSVLGRPELRYRSSERRHTFGFVPFFRYDGEDGERSHVDVREAYWRYRGRSWDVVAGVDRLFWGVTESRHLVDVVNQVDGLEDLDEEDRLGQPMVGVGRQQSWGRVELYALLGFRERRFAGDEGRLRPPLPVDDDDATFESGAGDERVDVALRYSHFVGAWDVGFHYFHGNGREPELRPSADATSLVPHYAVVHQAGVDLQLTHEAWLWKLETIVRSGQGDPFAAAVGGFEYTLYGVGRSSVDVGLLVEYLHDGRDDTAPTTPFEHDLFVGTRIAWNDAQDSSLLAGAVVDREHGSIAATLEVERRLGEHLRVEATGRFFLDVDPGDRALAPIRDDGFLAVELGYSF